MSQNILRVRGSEGLRLSDITVNNPRESYKFRDIRVDAIDVILSDRTIDPVSIQITATCTLEALGLEHEHNFQYKGVVDGKHRFECSCGEIREEELANGSRSQQDSTGSDASNQ